MFSSHQLKNGLNSLENINQVLSNEVGAKLLNFNSRENVLPRFSSHQSQSSLDNINQNFLSKFGANFQNCFSSQKKSSSKVSFLSYWKQSKQFTEHQSIFLNNMWAKIWGCNSFQERSCPKWKFMRWKTVWRTSTNFFPANLERQYKAIICSQRQVPPKCSSHQL